MLVVSRSCRARPPSFSAAVAKNANFNTRYKRFHQLMPLRLWLLAPYMRCFFCCALLGLALSTAICGVIGWDGMGLDAVFGLLDGLVARTHVPGRSQFSRRLETARASYGMSRWGSRRCEDFNICIFFIHCFLFWSFELAVVYVCIFFSVVVVWALCFYLTYLINNLRCKRKIRPWLNHGAFFYPQ